MSDVFSLWCHYCGRFCQHSTAEHFCKQCHTRPAKRKFCSRSCYERTRYRKHYTKRRLLAQRYYYTRVSKTPAVTVCQTCGKNFIPKRGGMKFCGVRCNNNASRKRFYDRHKRKPVHPFHCRFCGKLCVPKSGRDKKKFCSTRCLLYQWRVRSPEIRKAINDRHSRKLIKTLGDSYIRRLLKNSGVTPTTENMQALREQVRQHRMYVRAFKAARIFSMLNVGRMLKSYGARK